MENTFEKAMSETFQLFYYMVEKYARANYLLMLKVDLNIDDNELHESMYLSEAWVFR